MLDVKQVRQHPEVLDKAMKDRNATWDKQTFLTLDAERRKAIGEAEQLQASRNAASKEIGNLMREGKRDQAQALKEKVASQKEQLAQLEEKSSALDAELQQFMSALPNIPDEATPVGKDETENVEVRRWNTPREFDFEPAAHWDLGPKLGIIDFERGVKLAGSRFYLLGGAGARLERALINFFIDLHVKAGYKEWWPPVITNADTLYGTGQLPKFEEDLFHVAPHFYLIPTAEVVLTNIHRDEILDASALPLNYTAFTPCFREEAGSAGRDTRGIIRVHEFDKVEMVRFAEPEQSDQALEEMVAEAEACLQALELPYRVVSLCTGDLGFSAAKTFDLEVWLPSYNDYKEISSCSNCRDFQARRANIRYKDVAAFQGTRYVHTLNGSGLAVGRAMAAIIENFQTAEGTVRIPHALQPYMGGLSEIQPENSPLA